MRPWKLKKVQPLVPLHRRARLQFAQWFLEQPEEFADFVVWSVEKWYQLTHCVNHQNDHDWSIIDPGTERLHEVNVQGEKKPMCWAALLNRKLLVWPWLEDDSGSPVGVNQMVTERSWWKKPFPPSWPLPTLETSGGAKMALHAIQPRSIWGHFWTTHHQSQGSHQLASSLSQSISCSEQRLSRRGRDCLNQPHWRR